MTNPNGPQGPINMLDPVIPSGQDVMKADAPLEKSPGLTPEEIAALGDTPLQNTLANDPVDFDVQNTLRQHHSELLRIGSIVNDITGNNPGATLQEVISERVGELETFLHKRFGFKIRKR